MVGVHTKKFTLKEEEAPVPEAMKIVTPASYLEDHTERVEAREYWEDGLVELGCCGRNSDQQ